MDGVHEEVRVKKCFLPSRTAKASLTSSSTGATGGTTATARGLSRRGTMTTGGLANSFRSSGAQPDTSESHYHPVQKPLQDQLRSTIRRVLSPSYYATLAKSLIVNIRRWSSWSWWRRHGAGADRRLAQQRRRKMMLRKKKKKRRSGGGAFSRRQQRYIFAPDDGEGMDDLDDGDAIFLDDLDGDEGGMSRRTSLASSTGASIVGAPAKRLGKTLIYFEYKKQRYIYKRSLSSFQRQNIQLSNKTFRDLHRLLSASTPASSTSTIPPKSVSSFPALDNSARVGVTGLSTAEAEHLLVKNGYNEIEIDSMPVAKMLFDKIVHPFYVFQIFSIIIWLAEMYYTYALIIASMSTASIIWEIYTAKKNESSLRELVAIHQKHRRAAVVRDGTLRWVECRELVVGDVIVLNPPDTDARGRAGGAETERRGWASNGIIGKLMCAKKSFNGRGRTKSSTRRRPHYPESPQKPRKRWDLLATVRDFYFWLRFHLRPSYQSLTDQVEEVVSAAHDMDIEGGFGRDCDEEADMDVDENEDEEKGKFPVVCDMVLAQGQVVVDESTLTGESVPVIKMPIPKPSSPTSYKNVSTGTNNMVSTAHVGLEGDAGETEFSDFNTGGGNRRGAGGRGTEVDLTVYVPEKHKPHTLFAGSMIVQVKPPVLAVGADGVASSSLMQKSTGSVGTRTMPNASVMGTRPSPSVSASTLAGPMSSGTITTPSSASNPASLHPPTTLTSSPLSLIPQSASASQPSTLITPTAYTLALVTSTGFASTKGALFRSILFPPPLSLSFQTSSTKYLLILTLISFIALLHRIITATTIHSLPLIEILLSSLDLVTIAVPPALPLVLTVGVGVAVERLRRRWKVFCVEPGRVVVAGGVDFVCPCGGGRTRPLLLRGRPLKHFPPRTSNVSGDRTTPSSHINPTLLVPSSTLNDPLTVETPSNPTCCTDTSTLLEDCFASCHGLNRVPTTTESSSSSSGGNGGGRKARRKKARLVGHMVDLEVFERVGWEFVEPDVGIAAVGLNGVGVGGAVVNMGGTHWPVVAYLLRPRSILSRRKQNQQINGGGSAHKLTLGNRTEEVDGRDGKSVHAVEAGVGFDLAILKRFEFDSDLQRNTVVVMKPGCDWVAGTGTVGSDTDGMNLERASPGDVFLGRSNPNGAGTPTPTRSPHGSHTPNPQAGHSPLAPSISPWVQMPTGPYMSTSPFPIIPQKTMAASPSTTSTPILSTPASSSAGALTPAQSLPRSTPNTPSLATRPPIAPPPPTPAPQPRILAFSKGSPESIATLCDPATLPANFEGVYRKYAGMGYYVLACAVRDVTEIVLNSSTPHTNVNPSNTVNHSSNPSSSSSAPTSTPASSPAAPPLPRRDLGSVVSTAPWSERP
ncbi:hypothetical protein HK102_000644, partial [Quaeritorhiza haematococci]